VDSRVLMGDPLEFAQHLADRERILAAERNLGSLGEYVETVVIKPVPIDEYRKRGEEVPERAPEPPGRRMT